MQFNSIQFMIFFPIVLAVYFVIPKKLREIWLLIASYYFYMCWSPFYALLIGGSTAVSYTGGILIGYSDRERKAPGNQRTYKKRVLAVCAGINILVLVFFKYGNFILETLDALLSAAHIGKISVRFDFLMTIGISFYTFQVLSYLIDVYRGDIKPERNPVRYALFVSFFPKLISGPIEEPKKLLRQIRRIRKTDLWDTERIASGAILFIWGLFVKMVIADKLAVLTDNVFADFSSFTGTQLLIAVTAYSLQIYCDLNSYSTMAVGCARILGFELTDNFNSPYLARSIREFWGRWHITLSTWLKKYIYIPLGGNRKGQLRKAINIMIVFLVSGLWHGAAWNYVLWGGIHGLYQAAGDFLKPYRERAKAALRINTQCFSYSLFQTAITFALVTFAWIFFRTGSAADAIGVIGRIFCCQTPWTFFDGSIYQLGLSQTEIKIAVIALMLLFAADILKYRKDITVDGFLMKQNIVFEWLCVIALIAAIFVFGEYGPNFDAKQFIYFQF